MVCICTAERICLRQISVHTMKDNSWDRNSSQTPTPCLIWPLPSWAALMDITSSQTVNNTLDSYCNAVRNQTALFCELSWSHAGGMSLVSAACPQPWPSLLRLFLAKPPLASSSTSSSSLCPWLAFSPSASLCLFILPSLHQWAFHRGSREPSSQLRSRNVTERPSYQRSGDFCPRAASALYLLPLGFNNPENSSEDWFFMMHKVKSSDTKLTPRGLARLDGRHQGLTSIWSGHGGWRCPQNEPGAHVHAVVFQEFFQFLLKSTARIICHWSKKKKKFFQKGNVEYGCWTGCLIFLFDCYNVFCCISYFHWISF